MRSKILNAKPGSLSDPDAIPQACDQMICRLESMPTGRRFATRDGARFIRTNLICFGFCDLSTGHLCSARDVCSQHGGVAKREAHRFADAARDSTHCAEPELHKEPT